MPQNKSPNYEYLRDKWITKHKILQSEIAKKHKKSFEWLSNNTKQIAVGSLGGLMLMAAPIQSEPPKPLDYVAEAKISKIQPVDTKTFLIVDLGKVLPDVVRPLTADEEAKISEILSKKFGIKASAELNNLRLNRSYGYIGAEQHLARYPGDNMNSHFEGIHDDAAEYFSSGMAPGLGAWGYFSTSRANMVEEDTDREKYYIATQTFLAPEFNSKVAEYRDFFKYRKMLVVNPHNGKAVIAVIGDAGPAEWTGKHLGGSPEVMKHLERVDGSARGPVLYYFIDDPDNNIPLGPVTTLN